MGEIKTDLFPERLRAGRKDGETKRGGAGRQNGIHKNVVISVETLIERVDEQKGTQAD